MSLFTQASGEVSSSLIAPSAKANTMTKTTTIDLAGSKLRQQLGSNLVPSVAAPASEFARAQLQAMGWRPGQSVGKRRNGMTTALTVSRRVEEQAGLGTEKLAAQTRQEQASWWKHSLASTLANLQPVKARSGFTEQVKTDRKEKKRKGDDIADQRPLPRTYTDEELFAATGGVRFGMRAGKARNLDASRAESDISAPPTKNSVTDAIIEVAEDGGIADNEKERKCQRKVAKKARKEERKAKRAKKFGSV